MPGAAKEPLHRPSADAGALVLLVDDREMDRFLGRALLESEGFRVETAESGEDALKRFVALSPAAVVIDIYMAEIDGFETCRKLRLQPGGSAIPVLLMSGDSDDRLHARALECSADGLMLKSNDAEAIGSTIRGLIDRYVTRRN